MTYFTDTMLDILYDEDIPAETARAILASAINTDREIPAGYSPFVKQMRSELERLEEHRQKSKERVAKFRESKAVARGNKAVTPPLPTVTSGATDTSKDTDKDKESILHKKPEAKVAVGIRNTFKSPFKGKEAFDSACDALTPKLTELAEKWVQYKAERKEKYTPSGLTQVLKKIVVMGEARTESAVNFSMESNYAGLFEPNGNNQGRKPSSSLETGNYKEMPF